MKVKILRSFTIDGKKYACGETYFFSQDLAKRLVSRGDGEIIVEKEIRKPLEVEIKPKNKPKRKYKRKVKDEFKNNNSTYWKYYINRS